jgi:hypothetical protein
LAWCLYKALGPDEMHSLPFHPLPEAGRLHDPI